AELTDSATRITTPITPTLVGRVSASSKGKQVQKLLQEGYIPQLQDREITFLKPATQPTQPTQPTQSTQPALDLSIVYQSFDQAIEHVRHIILVTTETPLLPIPFGKPTSEDSLKGDRFIKGALEFAE